MTELRVLRGGTEGAYAVGRPPWKGHPNVLLVRGEHDRMAPSADRDLPGLGHNAHVENPAAIVALIE